MQSWTERHLVVRSVRHAHAAEAALRDRVPGNDAEAWAWDHIERILRDPAIIAGELERRRQHGPDTQLLADQASTERHLTKLAKQQGKLLRAFREAADDNFPLDLCKRELKVIEQEKARLTQTLAEIQQRITEQDVAIEQLNTLATYLRARRAQSRVVQL